MARTSTLSAEGCCRLQPTGKHNNRPPSVANRRTWLFLRTCVRPDTRGHADRARITRQGQLVGAEDVQREGLVNNCGRLRLGSLLDFRGDAGCEGEPAYRWYGRVMKGLLCVCTSVQLLRGTVLTLSLPRGCHNVNVFWFVYFAPLPLSSPRDALFVFKLFGSPQNPRHLLWRCCCWHLSCCVGGGGGAVFLLAFFMHNNPFRHQLKFERRPSASGRFSRRCS